MKAITTSFRLKGGLFPLTTLELFHYTKDRFEYDLKKKVAQAPDFFQQMPVILNSEHYEDDPRDIDLAQLQQTCQASGLMLAALRGSDHGLKKQAAQLQMGVIASGARTQTSIRPEKNAAVAVTSKLVTTPVRSGQQVYAVGGDLIVTGPVSAGAEILADGNIHIYGPLRGRALAGVNGNKEARIFCQSLEAELISIAGNFTTDEDAQSQHWKQPVHIHLAGQALCIEPLGYQAC